MTKDEYPWLAVAENVLAVKYDAMMDSALRESLIIGLQAIQNETCQKALRKLKKK